MLSKSELTQQLLGLNNPKSPYIFSRAADSDLKITWDYKKAYALLAPVKEKEFKKTYVAYLKLDDAEKTVKIFEEMSEETRAKKLSIFWAIIRSLGTGKMEFKLGSKETFRGSKTEISTKKVYSLGEAMKTGSFKAIDYTFNNRKVKKAVKKLVKKAGWKFKPVLSKKEVLK